MMASKVSHDYNLYPLNKNPSNLKGPHINDVDTDNKQLDFHKVLKSLCSLYYKISYKLEGEIPCDVGDQALEVFVLILKKNDKIETPCALQDLIHFVDHLLALDEVKDLHDETKDIKELIFKLDSFLAQSSSNTSKSHKPMIWSMNVLHLLGLECIAKNNIDGISNYPAGDLYGLQCHIRQIWDCRYEEIKSDNNDSCDLTSLKSFLGEFGYSDSVSRKLTDGSRIPEPLIACQNSLYWSTRYLNYKLFNNPLLAYVPRYPYEEEKMNEWFLQYMEDCDVKSDSELQALNMINVSNAVGEELVDQYIKSQGSGLFFHGTSHYDASLILTRGVELYMGSREQDFSDGNGFYLSDTLIDANKWARAGRGKYQAVIVYKLNLTGHPGVDLVGGSDDWQSIVAFYRGKCENSMKELDLLKNVKYIKGPACINPIAAIQENTKFEFDHHNQQLCIRDEAFANSECNTKNICCVIFY